MNTFHKLANNYLMDTPKVSKHMLWYWDPGFCHRKKIQIRSNRRSEQPCSVGYWYKLMVINTQRNKYSCPSVRSGNRFQRPHPWQIKSIVLRSLIVWFLNCGKWWVAKNLATLKGFQIQIQGVSGSTHPCYILWLHWS